VLLTSPDWHTCNSFLFKHHLGELHYPVIQFTSVGLGDFKLFPLLSIRSLRSHATTAASRSRVGSFVDQKWRLISFTCHKCTTLDPLVVLWIFIALKNLLTVARFGSNGEHVTTRLPKAQLFSCLILRLWSSHLHRLRSILILFSHLWVILRVIWSLKQWKYNLWLLYIPVTPNKIMSSLLVCSIISTCLLVYRSVPWCDPKEARSLDVKQSICEPASHWPYLSTRCISPASAPLLPAQPLSRLPAKYPLTFSGNWFISVDYN
jgi:hypothetical protein